MAEKWYDDATVLRSFSTALTNAEVLVDSDDFKDYFAKPYKWNEEFDAWQSAGYPINEEDDGWEDFVNALPSSEEEEEEDESDEAE